MAELGELVLALVWPGSTCSFLEYSHTQLPLLHLLLLSVVLLLPVVLLVLVVSSAPPLALAHFLLLPSL